MYAFGVAASPKPKTTQFKKLFIDEGVDLIGADDLDILIDVIQDVK